MKPLKNKKSQLSIIIIFAAVIIIVVCAMLIILVKIKHNDIDWEIKDTINQYNDEDFLISLLRVPYENVTIADKIAYYYVNDENKEELIPIIKEKLNHIFNKNMCWEITINNKKFLEYTKKCKRKKERVSTTIIPAFNKNDTLNVELTIW